ncbi:MAG: signal peptidase II [Burkholderiales bacterium]
MWRWLLIAAVVVALDQVTKYVAVDALTGQPPVAVTSFFNLLLVYNRGAAFSFLAGMGGWQRELFSVIAVLASIWIIWMLRRYSQQTLFSIALSLVLGGAIGNLIDRVTVGAVVDFLDFHAFGWHWPAFNVADSAITCGVALLIWDGLRGSKSPEK